VGSSVERWLQGGNEEVGSTTERWLRGEDEGDRLRAAARSTDPKQRERAIRILRVQGRTGLAPDVVERELETAEREARTADLDPDRLRRESPILAAWLAESPHHLAAASDDLRRLGFLERQVRKIRDRFREGQATVELSRIGQAAFWGRITPEQRRRQAELERDVSRADEDETDYGITEYFADVPGAIANQLPIWGQSVLGKVKGATIGAAGGATAGAVAGLAGGPAAPVTVPAAAAGGAVAGALLGFKYGAAVEAAKLEGYTAYLEYEKLLDETGQPLTRAELVGAAAITGVVNGSLEMLGFEAILRTAPGLRSLSRPAIKRALQQMTTRRAFRRYAAAVGEAVLVEGTTEAIQSMVTHATGELALMIKDGSITRLSTGAIIDRLFVENLPQAALEFRAGTQAGGGMAATLGGASFAVGIRRARAAEKDQLFIQALADPETKLRQLPEKRREVIRRITADGPVDKLYHPLETWNEHWTKQGIDPGTAAAEVLGSPDAYEEAQRTGADLIIPTDVYDERLAATEHHALMARELRLAPDAMNLREAEELRARLEATEEEAAAEPDQLAERTAAVETAIAEKLAATGRFDETEVRAQAKLYAGTFKSLATREGVDVADLQARFTERLEITTTEEQPVEPAEPVAGVLEQSRFEEGWRAALRTKDGRIIVDRSHLDAFMKVRPSLSEDEDVEVGFTSPDGRFLTLDETHVEIGVDVSEDLEQAAKKEPERIVAAAVRLKGKKIFRGPSHFAALTDLIQKEGTSKKKLLSVFGGKPSDLEDGFLTSRGRFVSHEEAGRIAVKAGQLPEDEVDPRGLIAEDLEFEQAAVARKLIDLPPGFHSKAERLIEVKMPVRAKVVDVANILKDVKAEEREWAGIDGLLAEWREAAGPEGLIEREVIISGLRAGRLEIVEARPELDDPDDLESRLNEYVEEHVHDLAQDAVRENWQILPGLNHDRWYAIREPEESSESAQEVHARLVEADQQSRAPRERGQTSIDKLIVDLEERGWTILVTMIGGTRRGIIQRAIEHVEEEEMEENLDAYMFMAREMYEQDPEAFGAGAYLEWTLPGGSNYQELLFQLPSARPPFSTGHWLGRENVLGWLRTKDRVIDPAAKEPALFIEEMQSDWHQRARELGYLPRLTPLSPEEEARYQELNNKLTIRDARGEAFDWDRLELNERREMQVLALRRDGDFILGGSYVKTHIPAAPFRRTWHEFLLKRSIRLAAEKGYAALAWTDGETQATRWGQTREKTALRWEIKGLANDGSPVFTVWGIDDKGNADALAQHLGFFAMTDYVGPEVEQKLKNAHARGEKEGRIEGPLKVGGWGNRIFYDQILVEFANSLGRRYGSRVEDRSLRMKQGAALFTEEGEAIGRSKSREVMTHYLPLTPELKRAALNDEFTLYQLPRPKPALHRAARTEIREKLETLGEALGFVEENVREVWARQLFDASMDYWPELPYLRREVMGEAVMEPHFEELSDEQLQLGRVYGYVAQLAELVETGNARGAYHLLALSEELQSNLLFTMPSVYQWVVESQGLQQPEDINLNVRRAVKDLRQMRKGLEDLLRQDRSEASAWVYEALKDFTTAFRAIEGEERPDIERAPEELTDEEFEFIRQQRFELLPVVNRLLELLEANDLKGARGYWRTLDADVHVAFDEVEGMGPLFTPWLYEQAGAAPRGRIRMSEKGISIALLQSADLSTFLHETGHFYLDLLEELAPTSPSIARDLATIRSWAGVPEDGMFTREHHELVARGFEAYLMEGKPPTPALRGAFARMRAWLLEVYGALTELDVELSDEVRGVFDRLVAGEAALDEASRDAPPALFADPGSMMPEAEARAYADAVAGARAAAEEELTQRLLNDVRRERTRRWRKIRDEVREEVAAEVNADPAWRALSVLRSGRLPDGSPGPFAGVRLDRASVVEMIGEDGLASLPRGIYRESGGVHPDQAAELLGFTSGAELLQSLPSRFAGSPGRHIARLTDQRLRAERGDLMSDPELLAGAALEAIHSDDRAKLLHLELQHLARSDLPALKGLLRRVARRAPDRDDVRADAERIVGRRKIRDLRPDVHRRAEARAAKAALDALLAGDVELAFEEKLRETLSHELWRASTHAIEESERIRDHAARFDERRTRERLKKAGGGYLEQIDGLLERFELRRVSIKQLERRQALLEFIEEQSNELGFKIRMPPEVLAEARRVNYKELTPDELRAVGDATKQLEHLARLKNRLLTEGRRRRITEIKAEMLASIRAAHGDPKPDPPDYTPGLLTRTKAGVSLADAYLSKMEFLFDFLDGYGVNLGPVWRALFKPIADAENAENALSHAATQRLSEIFGVYSRAERSAWFYRKIRIDGVPGSFTKANLLAVALNWGNDYNRQALMQGEGWTEVQVQKILNQLDERDARTVQAIWDFLESYWPAAERLERELNGTPPSKVQATPFLLKGVQMRGGYYHIAFDPERSWRQLALESKQAVQDLFGGRWTYIMTQRGHLEERRSTGGKPLLLTLDVLTRHVADVIHDLSHRRAVIDVARLIKDPEIRAAISSASGKDMYAQLEPWLEHIASARHVGATHPLERLFGRVRLGATVVSLGLKMTTAIVQWVGYTTTASPTALGPKYAGKGLKLVYNDLGVLKAHTIAISKSEYMRDRTSNWDRDARDALKRLNVAGATAGPLSVVNAYTHEMRLTFFYTIGLMDMGASLPTWHGAYARAMDGEAPGIEKGDEAAAIDYGDKMVRQTQGTGAPKDLAAIQRGPEMGKIFVMFYSYFSVLYQQFAKTGRIAKRAGVKGIPRTLASLTMLWFLPAVLSELIVGDPPGDDAEPEDWIKWFLKVEASYPFAAVALLRDIVNGLEFHRYEPSAALQAWDSLTQSIRAVGKVFDSEEDLTRADAKAGVHTVGYFAKLPTRQMWLTGEYLYDWWSGDEEPEDAFEAIWRAAVKGKERE
jgi:hypothetical protein